MKNVMSRAWEIYRTLKGDHIAKLKMAMQKAWNEVKKAKSQLENKVIDMYAEMFPKMFSAYSTLISRKQAGVIYSAFKKGFIDVKQEAIKMIYDSCVNVLGVPQIICEELEESRRLVKIALEAVFNNDYAVAEYALNKALEV